MFDTRLYTVLMDGPDDVSGLAKLLDGGEVAPKDIKGIMVTHEGDGYSRAFTTYAHADMLGERLGLSRDEVIGTIPIQAIAGMAGFLVPHAVVMVRREVEGTEQQVKRLVVAGGCTRDLLPEEVGTMTHLREVAGTVLRLMEDARISDPKDVHFVFVKGSWPSGAQRKEAESRGKKLAADDRLLLGEMARGMNALGSAVALGEVQESQVDESVLLKRRDTIYSMLTHCSVGGERRSNAVILLGNTTASVSKSVVGHGMMKDGLDVEGVKDTLKGMGFRFECCPSAKDLERIEYAFVKPKSGEVPTIRGYRHTINSDQVLGPFGWNIEKAPVHAVVASVLGTPIIEVASGAEHQGPLGSTLLAVVARTEQ
jgi:cyanuric acid amidohydrolase